jgi:hypothetical protein
MKKVGKPLSLFGGNHRMNNNCLDDMYITITMSVQPGRKVGTAMFFFGSTEAKFGGRDGDNRGFPIPEK